MEVALAEVLAFLSEYLPLEKLNEDTDIRSLFTTSEELAELESPDFGVIEILLEIEDEYKISLEEEQDRLLKHPITPGLLVELINNKLAKKEKVQTKKNIENVPVCCLLDNNTLTS